MITIDNKPYDTDQLSAEAKAQLVSLQFVDQELARLQAQTAALQTARNAYAKALQAALPTTPVGDTLKFNWCPELEADLQRELAQIQAESIGWQPLEPGAYLHLSDTNVTEVLVTGIAQAGAAVLFVGWGGNDSTYWSFVQNSV